MSEFAGMRLPLKRTVVAPDGADVRVLLGLASGGMAHFELAAGRTSAAVRAVTPLSVPGVQPAYQGARRRNARGERAPGVRAGFSAN